MRTLSSTLTSAQKGRSISPIARIVLTYGASTYTYDFRRVATSNTRLIKSTHYEKQWSQTATVVLNDSDKVLTSLDLEGYKGVISYGFTTSAGDEWSAVAPLWVVGQQRDSMQGKVICSLSLEGIFDRMAKDKASASYTQESGDTQTVKTLITAVAGATLAPFNHCKAFTVTYDSEDALIDTFKPADYFRVNLNDTRLSKIQELIAHTRCRIRPEASGNLHVFVPRRSGDTWAVNTAYVVNDYVQPTSPNNNFTYQCTTAGTSHATTEPTWPTTDGGTVSDGTVTWTARAHHYEYSLADTYHTFLSKRFRRRVVSPNYLVVKNHPEQGSYSGNAEDDSANLTDMEEQEFKYARITSNAQGTSIAKAILSRYQLQDDNGAGILPIMNVGAEVYDYNKITDSRAGDTVIGNVGYITRTVSQNKFGMEFGFGKAGVLPLETLAAVATGQATGYVTYETLQSVIDSVYGNFNDLVDAINKLNSNLVSLDNKVNTLFNQTRPGALVTFYVNVIAEDTTLTTGDGKKYVTMPESVNGMILVDANAAVYTVSSSGLPTIQVHNTSGSLDMLSTRITIDASEKTSFTAAAPSVVNTSNDLVVTGDQIRIDVDVAGTGTKGLDVILVFQIA